MSIGISVAVRAVPFFDLLDEEEQSLAQQVFETGGGPSEAAAMEASRNRLARGVDAFVRSLPTAVRSDVNTARMAAYALVGLADERMLHHPAGGLDRWRERLLEFELYGSALAGQEIVNRARVAAHSTFNTELDESGAALLAPLYLAIFRAGFEGSLRGDGAGLPSLTASLEETVGTAAGGSMALASGTRPARFGLPTMSLAAVGLAVWLAGGFAAWLLLSGDSLAEAQRIADRVAADLPLTEDEGPFERSIGPPDLSSLDDPDRDASSGTSLLDSQPDGGDC